MHDATWHLETEALLAWFGTDYELLCNPDDLGQRELRALLDTKSVDVCNLCFHPINGWNETGTIDWRCEHGCKCMMLGCIPMKIPRARELNNGLGIEKLRSSVLIFSSEKVNPIREDKYIETEIN